MPRTRTRGRRRPVVIGLAVVVVAGGLLAVAAGSVPSRPTGAADASAPPAGPPDDVIAAADEADRSWVAGHRARVAPGGPPVGADDAVTSASRAVPSAHEQPTLILVPLTTVAPRFDRDPPRLGASDDGPVARPLPPVADAAPSPPAPLVDVTPTVPAPWWAASTHRTGAGLLTTDVGCADDLGAEALDRFVASRVGPVLGWDYQRVIALGGDRYLWLFQDAFVDHSGTAERLDRAAFVHNAALLQEGRCFRLLHGGSATRPQPFEPGTGTASRATWFWAMGGDVHDGRLFIVWARMVKDAIDPHPPDGLGWHPADTWLATYDAVSFERLDFRPAPNAGVAPIYGYAIASDETHTYLFGNTFEQNLMREGGYWSGPHSATRIFLARVPRGELTTAPEYRTADGWTRDATAAVPILARHWVEFPLQPRRIDGQWVAVAAVDGYWSEGYSVDVAVDPWGPWTTVESGAIAPRAGDVAMNTYHAHLLPWRGSGGELLVTMSNNARDMRRDAWPRPDRYRPMVFTSPWVDAIGVAASG